ncbi:MAG TPA: 2'-5' RNA ligase family protein [Gaiellaceae bacterium]|nr:2'-5' RNA ligase family protein [Gaiellaceae bacterium]
MPRTALIVVIPEAETAVAALRLAGDSSAALGVPAHVTILYPFADGAHVDEAAIVELVASFHEFEFELDSVERFDDGLVWLHPEPSAPFLALIDAVWQRFPDHPPYEGAHDVVTPHLTVSETPVEVDVPLPIKAVARAVTLIEEAADGRWSVRRVFPLSPTGA